MTPTSRHLRQEIVWYSAWIMASRSVNKVILLGHLGKDAETKFTPSGVSVTKFSVATNRRWKDQQTGEWKEETDWSNVVLWRQENLANYLTKGKQVDVEGTESRIPVPSRFRCRAARPSPSPPPSRKIRESPTTTCHFRKLAWH